jgi:hypothetical protein
MDRRRFLLAVGGAAVAATLAPAAAWAGRTRQGKGGPIALQPWALPADAPAQPLEVARALVGAAVLAPSDWNTQPWRFEAGPDAILLFADESRTLAKSDPERRGLMVALGAALENLVTAARAWGLQPTVRLEPAAPRGAVAEVAWSAGGARRDRELLGAIAARRTNRRNYDGRSLLPQIRAQLGAQVADGARVWWLEEREALRDLGDLLHDAVAALASDRTLQREQHAWLRDSEREAARRGDGVPVDALGMSGAANWFAGRYYDPDSWFLRFGASSLAKRAREGVRSAGAAALLTVPERDRPAWLTGGQAFQRLALRATALGLAQQVMNAPIVVARFRAPLLRAFGAGGGEPLVLVRLGRDGRVDHTPRRAVTAVTAFSAST